MGKMKRIELLLPEDHPFIYPYVPHNREVDADLRKNGFVTLKTKGMRAMGINSKPKKPKDFIVQKKAEMAELFFRLEGWEVIFAKEFKKAVNFYNGARIDAVIENTSSESITSCLKPLN